MCYTPGHEVCDANQAVHDGSRLSSHQMSDDRLTAPEIVILIEGLDALIPSQEGSQAWLHAGREEHE